MSVDDHGAKVASPAEKALTVLDRAAAMIERSGIHEAIASMNKQHSALLGSHIHTQLAPIQAAAAAMESRHAQTLSAQIKSQFVLPPPGLAMKSPFADAIPTIKAALYSHEVLASAKIQASASQILASIEPQWRAQSEALAVLSCSPYLEGVRRVTEHNDALVALTNSGLREAAAHVRVAWPLREWATEIAEELAAERSADREAEAAEERHDAIAGVLTAALPVAKRTACPFAERVRRDASARASRGDRTAPRRRVGGRSPTASGSGDDPPPPGAPSVGLGSGDWNQGAMLWVWSQIAGSLLWIYFLSEDPPFWLSFAAVIWLGTTTVQGARILWRAWRRP